MNRHLFLLLLRCFNFVIWIILFSNSCANAIFHSENNDNKPKLPKLSSRSPRSPQTHIYNFNFSVINLAPDGVTRRVWTVNEQFPGPTIELTRGDRVIINVYNNLDEITTLHSHGITQKGTPWYDGIPAISQCGIPPKASFAYNFTVDDVVGTYW